MAGSSDFGGVKYSFEVDVAFGIDELTERYGIPQ
jgi:hypothetical protein